jgi:hypothetical protein
MTAVTDVFVAAGELAHEAGELPDAFLELAVRLDLKGAGDLLALITEGTCWAVHRDDGVCPTCGHKRPPDPHPKPKPPPPPPPRPRGGA